MTGTAAPELGTWLKLTRGRESVTKRIGMLSEAYGKPSHLSISSSLILLLSGHTFETL